MIEDKAIQDTDIQNIEVQPAELEQLQDMSTTNDDFFVGNSTIKSAEASQLVSTYYSEYGSYLINSRFLPNIYDGLKPPHKRLLFCADSVCSKSFVKSAKLLGETLSYHPHAVDGLYTALVGLTSNQLRVPIFQGKGSWGGYNSDPAAFRYTECHLNEIGRNYNQFLKYADWELGESGQKEPVAVPVLIPFCLLNGSKGMGVGLSTEVMPLNAMELIDYYIATIKNDPNKKIPTPDIGNFILAMEDVDINKAVLESKGQLVVRSVIVQENDHTVVVEGIFNKDMHKVFNSKFKDWVKAGALDFRDESRKEPRYVFEIINPSIVSVPKLIQRLNSATTGRMSYTRIVYEGNQAIYATLDYQVDKSLAYLNKVLDRKQANELKYLQSAKEKLLAIQYIRESGILNDISSLTTEELDTRLISAGFTPEIAKAARNNSISYLTKSHDDEITSIQDRINSIHELDRTEYLIQLYEEFRQIIKPIYDSRKHTIRGSLILLTPRISLSKDKKEIVISNTGQDCDNTVLLVDKKGRFKTENVFSQVKRTIKIDESLDIVGLITDKSDVGALYTNKGRILARTFSDLSRCRPVIKLDDDEEIIGILTAKYDDFGDAIVKYKGQLYDLNMFTKQRISVGISNWQKRTIKR